MASKTKAQSVPKVSIICITYNHEKFIAETLDGFLMQKTDFPIEIIIHDDASTDKTAEIIKEYAKKHPTTITPMFEKTNQYSKGNGEFINDMMRQAKGKYIAECEGDDYWTDPSKLQKQVDFLDANPKHTVCFHPVQVIFEDNSKKSFVYPDPKNADKFTKLELIKRNYIHSCSILYRRQEYQPLPVDILPLDWYQHLFHAQFGEIGFLPDVMAVYRRHKGGIWWESHQNMDKLYRDHGVKWLGLHVKTLPMFSDNREYKELIEGSIITILNRFAEIDKQYNEHLILDSLKKYPEVGVIFINNLLKQIISLDAHSIEQAKIIKHYQNMANDLKAQNELLNAKKLVRLEGSIKRHLKRNKT